MNGIVYICTLFEAYAVSYTKVSVVILRPVNEYKIKKYGFN